MTMTLQQRPIHQDRIKQQHQQQQHYTMPSSRSHVRLSLLWLLLCSSTQSSFASSTPVADVAPRKRIAPLLFVGNYYGRSERQRQRPMATSTTTPRSTNWNVPPTTTHRSTTTTTTAATATATTRHTRQGLLLLHMATSSKDLKKETEKAKKSKTLKNNLVGSEKTIVKSVKGSGSTSSSTSSKGTLGSKTPAATKTTPTTTTTTTTNILRDPTSVVVRLSRAAKDAAAVTAAMKAQGDKPPRTMRRRQPQLDSDDDTTNYDDIDDDDDNLAVYDNGKRMGSVLDLTSVIEEELELHSFLAGQMNRPRLSAVEPSFSLSNSQLNLIRHNDIQELRQAHARLRQERNRMSNKNNQGLLLSLDPKEAAAILSLDPLEAAAILGQLPRLQDDDDDKVVVDEHGKTITTTTPRRAPLPSTCHVAVVFPKPLLEGQTTVEYASRLEALARALANGYKPLLICLLSADGSGGFTGTNDSSVVDDATAGYIYLQQLCATNKISLKNIHIRIVPMKQGTGEHQQQQQQKQQQQQHHNNINNNKRDRVIKLEGDYSDSLMRDSDRGSDIYAPPSFQPVVQEIQHDFLDAWLDQSDVYESKTDEYGMTRRQPRKKVHIHFTFFSTDYQLCNLNDIHTRSPRQSLLSTLKISATDGSSSMSSSLSSSTPRRCIVETTWSFRYSAYPFRDGSDEVESFLGNCYLMSQDLQPLLVNLRGVVTNEEFFQRDNYRTLVAVRRSLVSLVEGMYRDTPTSRTNDKKSKRAQALSAVLDISQSTYLPSNVSPESIEEDGDRRRRRHGPSLKSLLQKVETRHKHNNTTGTVGGRATSVDVTLESALLSLGRCLDLVRPAGLMLAHTSVPKQDWKQALRQLEHFLDLMQTACDPDRPLKPEEWGKVLNTAKRTIEKAESATMYHDTDPRSADLDLTDNDEDDLSKMLRTTIPWQADSVD